MNYFSFFIYLKIWHIIHKYYYLASTAWPRPESAQCCFPSARVYSIVKWTQSPACTTLWLRPEWFGISRTGHSPGSSSVDNLASPDASTVLYCRSGVQRLCRTSALEKSHIHGSQPSYRLYIENSKFTAWFSYGFSQEKPTFLHGLIYLINDLVIVQLPCL